MIKNYLKIAWRNLVRNRLYSFINIGGLAIGMAVSFMLLLYVYNEFSFDKFNANSERLYQVMRNQPSNGELMTNSATPATLAPAIVKDFPEVERACRTSWGAKALINFGDKSIKLATLAADPSLFDMFSFKFIQGSINSAFADESSIVLTKSGATALFGKENAIGKVIRLSGQFPLKVSGIIEDNPLNSSFHFEALISWTERAETRIMDKEF